MLFLNQQHGPNVEEVPRKHNRHFKAFSFLNTRFYMKPVNFPLKTEIMWIN